MNRRQLLGLTGLAPFALIASKIPVHNAIVSILLKRWKSSRAYTLKVFDAMPEGHIEFAPSEEQLSFAQHFMHLGLINTFYFGILTDSKTYPDFKALIKAEFVIHPPDGIHLFEPDSLEKRDPNENKAIVSKYIADTFDFAISILEWLNDEMLTKGTDKEKPEFLSGHSNLDLVLRGEMHTAHHRAQAIGYLRTLGLRPPPFTPYNRF